jgi:hypothetical protein
MKWLTKLAVFSLPMPIELFCIFVANFQGYESFKSDINFTQKNCMEHGAWSMESGEWRVEQVTAYWQRINLKTFNLNPVPCTLHPVPRTLNHNSL